MNGLEARLELAMARVLQPINEHRATSHLAEAFRLAEADGYYAWDCSSPVPAAFVGEGILELGWESGQEMASQRDEIASCPDCQDRNIEMCPVHDCR